MFSKIYGESEICVILLTSQMVDKIETCELSNAPPDAVVPLGYQSVLIIITSSLNQDCFTLVIHDYQVTKDMWLALADDSMTETIQPWDGGGTVNPMIILIRYLYVLTNNSCADIAANDRATLIERGYNPDDFVFSRTFGDHVCAPEWKFEKIIKFHFD